jgi:hypothetical protein
MTVKKNTIISQRDYPTEINGGGIFEIKVGGHLDAHWSDRLGGLTIHHDSRGNTLLTGIITDQAALHGILVQIRDLGLTLISLNPLGIDK